VRITAPAEAVRLGLAYLPRIAPAWHHRRDVDRRQHHPRRAARDQRGGFLDFAAEREIAASYQQRFAIKAPSIGAAGGDALRRQSTESGACALAGPRGRRFSSSTSRRRAWTSAPKAEIHGLIVDLAAQGLAILLISSELSEVAGMSDRVVRHARRHPSPAPSKARRRRRKRS